MGLDRISITNYRSLRELSLDLEKVTVLVGANGSGKTNCYRALGLVQAAATGVLAGHFASEGGISGMAWAGFGKRRDEIRGVRIAVEASFDRFVYSFSCGVPIPNGPSLFSLDPEVKEEALSVLVPGRKKPVPICTRKGHIVSIRDEHGAWFTPGDPLDPTESVLVQLIDPARYPELAVARYALASWRFYHQFRTDPDSPLRQPGIAVRTPILSHDGATLVATLRTIMEMGEAEALEIAITTAFPGCRLSVTPADGHRLVLHWQRPDLTRPLLASELSDGTLRFIALAAALLTPRPPALLVLNEPEAGLHPNVIPALAGLIAQAATRGQVIVTTHLVPLAEAITAATGAAPTALILHQGATMLADDLLPGGGRRIRLG